MPKDNKKKNRGKRKYTRKIGRPGKALRPANPYLFKRTVCETLHLSNAEPPAGWTSTVNNLGKAFGWTLSAIHDYDDFTNLFKFYRLKGARVKMYCSNTSSGFGSGRTTDESPNGQIIATIDLNQDGNSSLVATESHYLDSQTAKRRLMLRNDGRPSLDIYMPLKQLTEVRNVAGGTAVAMTKPKFVGTNNAFLPHYGYNIMLQRIDGNGFSANVGNKQIIKMYTTLYFECKKVE